MHDAQIRARPIGPIGREIDDIRRRSMISYDLPVLTPVTAVLCSAALPV